MKTNDIISIITYTIKTNFPDARDVYKENVPQNFKPPAFLIEEIEGKYNHAIGRKYKKHVSLSIKYFPNYKLNSNQDMHNVADKLTEILELMQYKEMVIKGQNMNSKITDDNVLHFFIDIKVSTLKDKYTNKFRELKEVDVSVKE